MSDFDESKVTRDEKGRFSGGGLGGFVAKHTGKLEGYAGKGEPGAGRLEHEPHKETSPLGKWVASKHSIDLDLMKASKDDRNPSTGELTANNIHRAGDFIAKEITRLTMQKEALVKEARKAEVSRVGYHSKVMTAKHVLEDVTPPHGEEAKDAAKRDEAQKALAKAAPKETEAAARRDAVHEKLGNVLAQWRSANDAQSVMLRVNGAARNDTRETEPGKGDKNFPGNEALKIPGRVSDDKSDYRFNVSHDRAGNWEITANANTRSEDHPGEKSLSYRVGVGTSPKIISIDKRKNITFDRNYAGVKTLAGARAMIATENAPTHSMQMTFPPHKDTGASHPLDGETIGTARFKDEPNVPNFFHERDVSK